MCLVKCHTFFYKGCTSILSCKRKMHYCVRILTLWLRGLFHRERTGSGSTFRLWEEPEASVSTGNRVGVEPRSWFGTGTISSLGFSQRTVTTYVGVWLLSSAAGAQRPWNIITLLKGQIYKLTARRSAPLSQLGDHFIFATVSITARHCTVYKQHVLNIKN